MILTENRHSSVLLTRWPYVYKPLETRCSLNMKSFGVPLFNRICLEELDLKSVEAKFNPKLNILEPGPGLVVRPLNINDFDRGYTDLLAELTEIGSIDRDLYEKTFKRMQEKDGTYYVTVIEDTLKNNIVGAGTLLIEQKFIHGCAMRGRLEDVVVSDKYRGKQLGKVLVHLLTQFAKELDCYKVTLECKDSNRQFYERLGYKKEENNSNHMQIRFDKSNDK